MQNYSNDPIATKLIEAARANDVVECKKHFGLVAAPANVYVNAHALLVAAEHKSYDVFEHMLDTSSKNCSVLATPFTIHAGADWLKVEELSKTDERLAAALDAADKNIDINIKKVFQALQNLDRDDTDLPQEKPATSPGLLQRLKFW